jgi:HlyD family secretion protein
LLTRWTSRGQAALLHVLTLIVPKPTETGECLLSHINRLRQPRRRAVVLTWLLAVVVAAITAVAGCGAAESRPAAGAQGEAQVVPAVEVLPARAGRLPLSERLTGTVRATGEVAIYPQATGSIAEVLVQNGSRVAKGDVLVRIRSVGTGAQVDQARSGLVVAQAAEREAAAILEQLQSQYDRYASLGEGGLVPADTVATLRSQVQAARASLARTKAEVAQARALIGERADVQAQTTVRAPIAGRVGQRNAEVGMRVDPQSALFTIGRLETVRVEVPVSQDLLPTLARGQRVEIAVPGREATVSAQVSRISPFLDSASYTAEVEIDVPNASGALVPGMFVTVDVFHGTTDEATLVPVSALFTHPTTGRRGIYVTPPFPQAARRAAAEAPSGVYSDPVTAAFRPVEVLGEGRGVAGVSGVREGEWVVVVGQHLLAEQGPSEAPRARPRAIAWNRVMELQRLQRDDLLESFMARQQRLGLAPAPTERDR